MGCLLRQKRNATSARRKDLSGIRSVSVGCLPQVLLILLIFFPCPFHSRGPLHLFSCFAEQWYVLAGALFCLAPTTQNLSGMFLQLFALHCFSSLFLQGGINSSSNRYNGLAKNKSEKSSLASVYLCAWLEDSPKSMKLALVILLVVTYVQNDLSIKTIFKSSPTD